MAGWISERFRDAAEVILFTTTMAFIAGFVTFLRADMQVFGLPAPVFAGLLYAAFVGSAAMVTGILLPALHRFIEASAVSRLTIACAAFSFPEFGAALHASPCLSATLVVGGALLIRQVAAHPLTQGWPALAFLPSRRAGA